jgi:predicted dehydrogenase
MKQLLQSLKNGRTEIAQIPCPAAGHGKILIETRRSLVSAGTERMLVEFGKAGWIEKARQQPDKVRQVLDKVRSDGILPTLEAVRSKLDRPIPLGYCNVGTVLEVGKGVTGYEPGDRVASNGHHAEVVAVSEHLCARVPDNVGDDAAAFTVVGAIALQGIRLVQPTLGETVTVTGLGLIGLLTVQLLRAHGCKVIGIDFDPEKVRLAAAFGAETIDLSKGVDPVAAAERLTRGRGVDAVIITASTSSDEPVHQAALMCRKRGRIVLVGVAGLKLSRADFFEKELSFQVSCSYGPGRYDTGYEEEGLDYPIGFVRWTEQRNFEAVLDMMSDGRIDVTPLISHRFELDEVDRAYALVSSDEPSLGILLAYPRAADAGEPAPRQRALTITGRAPHPGQVRLGFVGAGNYATAVLIPAFAEAGAHLATIASSGGISGTHAARKFGIGSSTTDVGALVDSPEIDAVIIATRHDSHADLVRRALATGKHVFVEKPMALTAEELDAIAEARAAAVEAGLAPVVTVGFNRRFAPHVRKMKELLGGAPGPKSMVMTANAGAIPADHWVHDPVAGGGRVLGEACHYVDLLRFLAGAPIESVRSQFMDASTRDTATIELAFADGSIGTVHYFANGNRRVPKERLEVYASGKVLQLDNFRRLDAFGWPGFSRMKLRRQDKGQRDLARAFIEAIRTGTGDPIPFDELVEVSRAAIQASGLPASI